MSTCRPPDSRSRLASVCGYILNDSWGQRCCCGSHFTGKHAYVSNICFSARLQASPVSGKTVRFQGPGGAGAADAEDAEEADGVDGSPTAAGSPQQQRRPGQGPDQAPVLGPHGRRAIDALFDGLAAEFHTMVRRCLLQFVTFHKPTHPWGIRLGFGFHLVRTRSLACDKHKYYFASPQGFITLVQHSLSRCEMLKYY